MATYFIDPIGGNNANAGTSFALRKKYLNASITPASGDEIRYVTSPAPASIGSGGWTKGGQTVTFGTPLPVAVVDAADANWTASANVTSAVATTNRAEGTNALTLTIAAAFTTGLAAYKATGSLNLSAYDQLSFVLRTSSIMDNLYLALCSDVAGAVIVDRINIKDAFLDSAALTGVQVGQGSGIWSPIVAGRVGGGNFGAAIQSIALYVDTDQGAQTVNLDNFIATTAASGINHNALIGKNGAAGVADEWYNIMSINPSVIGLGASYNFLSSATAAALRPYNGTTATVATYLQSTYPAPILSASRQLLGSASNNFDIVGGYDAAAMSSVTGKTFMRSTFVGANPWWVRSTQSVAKIKNFVFVGSLAGQVPATGVRELSNCDLIAGASDFFNSLAGQPINNQGERLIRRFGYINQQGGPIVLHVHVPNSAPMTLPPMYWIDRVMNTASTGEAVTPGAWGGQLSTPATAYIGAITGSGTYGLATGAGDWVIQGTQFADNVTSDLVGGISSGGSCNLVGATASPTITRSAVIGNWSFNSDTKQWMLGGNVVVQGAVVNLGSTALQISPVSAVNAVAIAPMRVSLGKFYLAAGVHSASAYLRRDNVSLAGKLLIDGVALPGSPQQADVEADISAAINTWQQLTLNFTTASAGVVELWTQWYGGTTFNGYVADVVVA
jgi:hypothetical protein